MKVGILLHPYNEKTPAGLGRSVFELTRALLAHDRENDYIIYLKDEPTSPLPFSEGRWSSYVLGGGSFWLDRGFFRAPQADIYLFGTPVTPFFFRLRKSMVIVHDFAYQDFPSASLSGRLREKVLGWYHGYSLRRADHIVSVSRATKNEIIRRYHIAPDKISVIHWGFKDICKISEQPIEAPEKFFLFVGAVKERKNVLNTVKAFIEFANRRSGYELLIVGNSGGSYADIIQNYLKTQMAGDKVHFLGHISDEELSYIYKRAVALVFPSFVEGFGFPILEAFACGLPVITSNVSSLPEIAEDAALLVDPRCIRAIARAMEKIVFDARFRDSLVRKGRERAGQFSWERTAREYVQVLSHITRV